MLTLSNIWTAQTTIQNYDKVISILDTQDNPDTRKLLDVRLPKDRHYIARFDDTEHPKDLEFMQMTREIHRTIDWVQLSKLSLDTDLLVHCHAGVSRSSAMSMLLLVMFGMSKEDAFRHLWHMNHNIWPNQVVLEIGSKYLNLGQDFLTFCDQINTEIAANRDYYLGYGG